MFPHRAGGSTQQHHTLASVGLRPRAAAHVRGGLAGRAVLGGASLAACLVGLLGLSGCESFAFQARAPQVADTGDARDSAAPAPLLSPLASALIGPDSLPATQPLDAAPPEALSRPDIELEALPPPRPGDLLARLRNSFSLHGSDDPAFRQELEWFASHPEYMKRVFDRGAPYLYYIANQLYMRGMPAELALLPIVESAYDPFAYSRGRAEGLWQIIPGTARRLGVRQDWWFDGRRDVVESTRAALDYLEVLHERFDGDWLLAIAGYNSGGGTVAHAIERARAAGRGTDFWSIRRYLPKETRTYVPRLLAICSLVAHPQQFDLELPRLPDVPQLAVVDTGGQIDMARAAELAGVEVDALYKLNPGVNRWATDPSGPHRLVVPLANAEAFESGVAALDDADRVRWTRYKIEPGDTLSVLARKFATTPAVLQQVNKLHGNAIRAGDYLMIPHAEASLGSYTQTLEARLARQRDRVHDGERHVHVVRSGDSLWTLSRRYGVSVGALAKWNAMAPGDTLSVGRKLVVWTADGDQDQHQAQVQGQGPGQGAPRLTAVSDVGGEGLGAAAGPGIGADDRIRRVNYVVRRGDSLSRIAHRFRVGVADVLKWNDGLSTKRYLQPGQRVVLFVNVAEQST